MKHNDGTRFLLTVQLMLAVDIVLVCAHELFPVLTILPLGGGHLAQLALTVVLAISVVELCHCGRLCCRAIRAWWRQTDQR